MQSSETECSCCASVFNHLQAETDRTQDRLEQSVKYLESYAYLICFNAYLRDTRERKAEWLELRARHGKSAYLHTSGDEAAAQRSPPPLHRMGSYVETKSASETHAEKSHSDPTEEDADPEDSKHLNALNLTRFSR